MMHPSQPPSLGEISRINEGFAMRMILRKIGVPTPTLLSISEEIIVEEYIPGGNLYRAFSHGRGISLSYTAGLLTGRLHNAGYSFIDNKCQNYLINDQKSIVRTDLGFTQKNASEFSRGMDIATFLASVIDLEQHTYLVIENLFLKGYVTECKLPTPFFWSVLRNILSFGFSSDRILMVRNMLRSTV
jgi:tRNA A-37 threonylcarbamoyl transferase component Bud32